MLFFSNTTTYSFFPNQTLIYTFIGKIMKLKKCINKPERRKYCIIAKIVVSLYKYRKNAGERFMLEIIIMVLLCIGNSKRAKQRGRSGGGAIAYTLALWIGLEFTGAFIAVLLLGVVPASYVIALAFCCYGRYHFVPDIQTGQHRLRINLKQPIIRALISLHCEGVL